MKTDKTAVCCIAKNEENYIDEWIQYHWKLGFDDIFVYQNDWRYTGELAAQNATSNHKLYLFELDGKCQQLNAYNHFIEQFGDRYDYVALIDVDEFLVVNSGRNLREVLDKYCERAPAIGVNWRLFGDSGLQDVTGCFQVLSRFTHCEAKLNSHVKQIVNLRMNRERSLHFRMLNPHFGTYNYLNLEGNVVGGPFNRENLDKDHELELNHYVTKTYPELVKRVARGRADTPTGREDADTFFKEHNKNEVERTVARDFFYTSFLDRCRV